MLRSSNPDGTLIGLDADRKNLDEAARRLAEFGGRVQLHHANFRDVWGLLRGPVHVLFADLGVSSPHFDDPMRGFTFRSEAPLDLRFDQTKGESAAEWISSASAQEITDALRSYGELRDAYKLGLEIEKVKPQTTTALCACVEQVCRWRTKSVLPQVFQALRIVVNDELAALQAFLDVIPLVLHPGGRCGIISYHSLEDRLVKTAFRSLATVEKNSATGQDIGTAAFAIVTKKLVTPSEKEIAENPRARSAKFRVIQRAA
jgi:16S rRNA (cytosine1402-N4)-methyltransferase